jgi:hypothetical protein
MDTARAGKTGAPISDGNSPWNEAFSFSPETYQLLKKLRPDLFDRSLDPQEKARRWKAWAQTSEGRAFRWR